MGTWGPGVYENDHALDLHDAEIKCLVDQVEKVLGAKQAAFDSIEGPLVYVHILALLAQEQDLPKLDRARVERWRTKYLDIFDSTIGSTEEGYAPARREVISREFDSLMARLRR